MIAATKFKITFKNGGTQEVPAYNCRREGDFFCFYSAGYNDQLLTVPADEVSSIKHPNTPDPVQVEPLVG